METTLLGLVTPETAPHLVPVATRLDLDLTELGDLPAGGDPRSRRRGGEDDLWLLLGGHGVGGE